MTFAKVFMVTGVRYFFRVLSDTMHRSLCWSVRPSVITLLFMLFFRFLNILNVDRLAKVKIKQYSQERITKF